MAREIGDGEHFVAEAGDEEEFDFGEETSHFFGNLAAEAVGLDEVDSGEKAGLPEGVGPGVGDLGFELVDGVIEGDLFEGGGSFGEEDELERVVGPIGEGDFRREHAQFFHGVEGGAVDVRGGIFLHPAGKVADAEALDTGGGVEVEVAGDGGEVAGIGAGDGVEDEGGVFDAAGHGAELVERPAEGHGAGARDAAEGGAESGDAAAHAGADDAAAGFAADAEADECGSGGGAGSSARAGGAFFEEPGVHGLAAEPDVVEGEGAEAELGEKNGAGVMEALDDSGVFCGDAIAENFCSVSGGDAGGVKQIFAAPGDAVERAAVAARGDFGVGLAGLLRGRGRE